MGKLVKNIKILTSLVFPLHPSYTTGKNYKSVLDVNGQYMYNKSQLIHGRNFTSDRLKYLISVLSKLIDIRDGYKDTDGLCCDDTNASYWVCAQINFCVVYIFLPLY